MSTSLLFVGDVMLGRWVNNALREKPAHYPWGDTLDLFGGADWRACNLECAISDRGAPWSKTRKAFHFRADAKNVAVLSAAHIDCVSLANNHALDFGYNALEDATRILSAGGITHAGAGADRAAAQYMPTMRAGDITIGLMAFTDDMSVWEATEQNAGVYYVPVTRPDARTSQLIDSVKAAREQVDVLIVSAHWGPNWGYQPPKEHMALGRKLIDEGASVVYGHSAHVCRGVEIYRGRPILYSTGNFIDDYAVDPTERNDRSFMFCVKLESGKADRVELFPTVIREFQARKAQGDECRQIVDKMTELCRILGTQPEWRESDQCLRISPGRSTP